MLGRFWFATALVLFVGWTAGASEPIETPLQRIDERAPVSIPEATPLAVRFHETGHWVWAFAKAWDLAVPALILLSGLSVRMRDFARKVARGRLIPTVALYLSLFLTLSFLADLPLSYFVGFVRQHAYGLSNQTFAKWLGNSFKGHLVDVLGASAFAWVPFWLIGRFPKHWWLILSGLSIPFTAFVVLITPVWIDPLFNEFGPMKNKALEAKILALAERAGIEGGQVFEVNKSVDTKAVNAYVTGLLGTHRIVLWDTLLARLDDRGVLAVMGHEMGHFALRHVERGVLLSSVLVLAGLFWTDRAGRRLIARFGSKMGVDSLADIAATPLLLILLSLGTTALYPIGLAFSRYQEHEADRFSLELTRTNHSAALAFADLQRENLGIPQPDPFCMIFRYTHPSVADRITFCNTYRPWDETKPLRYSDRFKP